MRRIVMMAAALAMAACGGAKPKPTPLTERQKDSVIGASKLPGAAGVRGALRATDSAAARNARYDSISHAAP